MVYAGDSTLYTGTNVGKVGAWDTNNNSCFMHWEADSSEIGTLNTCIKDGIYMNLYYRILFSIYTKTNADWEYMDMQVHQLLST